MFKKGTTLLAIAVPLLALLCVGTALLAGKSQLGGESATLQVTEFYFCIIPNQNLDTPSPIEKLSLTQPVEELYICGKAITDGRPASIIILIYKNNVQVDFSEYETPGDLYEYVESKQVFVTSPGETVENGFFQYCIPENTFQEVGVYSAIVFHGRPLQQKARILIIP